MATKPAPPPPPAPRPMSPQISAGTPVQPCPFALQKLDAATRAKVVPCDVKSVTLTLADKKGAVTVNGSKRAASTAPVAGIDPEINKLLQSHAVVIVQVVPATTVSDKVAANIGTGKAARHADLAKTKGKAEADASFSAQMKAQCGDHPKYDRTPAPTPPAKDKEKKDGDPKARALAADTQEWTAVNFLKAIFGGTKFRDFIFGQQDEVIFDAHSCGFPAGGDPTYRLTGCARLALADEWQADFNWGQGFKLEFGATSTHGKVYREGSSSKSATSSVKSSAKSLESSRSAETISKGGELVYGKIESKVGDKSTEIEYKADDDKKSIEARLKTDEFFKENSEAVAEKFKKHADKLKDLSSDGTLSVKLVRNGKDLVDTNNLAKALKELQETLETGLDLVNRLVLLLETGAKIGIPVSLTFGLKASLVLLTCKNYARFWAEAQPPKQGGSYYIANYRRRWQVGVDMTVVSLSFTPTITLQAKIMHEWIASLTLSIEGKISGSAKIGYSITDGTGACDLNAVGKIAMSVKGSGEAAAVSCYIIIKERSAAESDMSGPVASMARR